MQQRDTPQSNQVPTVAVVQGDLLWDLVAAAEAVLELVPSDVSQSLDMAAGDLARVIRRLKEAMPWL